MYTGWGVFFTELSIQTEAGLIRTQTQQLQCQCKTSPLSHCMQSCLLNIITTMVSVFNLLDPPPCSFLHIQRVGSVFQWNKHPEWSFLHVHMLGSVLHRMDVHNTQFFCMTHNRSIIDSIFSFYQTEYIHEWCSTVLLYHLHDHLWHSVLLFIHPQEYQLYSTLHYTQCHRCSVVLLYHTQRHSYFNSVNLLTSCLISVWTQPTLPPLQPIPQTCPISLW